MNSTFALWKKWFWVGIVIAALNPLAGLIIGIAIATEKDRAKEGTIIIAWSIVWWTALVIISLRFGGHVLVNPIQPQQ